MSGAGRRGRIVDAMDERGNNGPKARKEGKSSETSASPPLFSSPFSVSATGTVLTPKNIKPLFQGTPIPLYTSSFLKKLVYSAWTRAARPASSTTSFQEAFWIEA
jgi:hypothetical protein